MLALMKYSILLLLMNKIIEAKLKQTPRSEFLFYYPYLSLAQQLGTTPKNPSGRKRLSKQKPAEQKRGYDTQRQKSKQKDAFIKYLSMKKTYNISPILHLKESRVQSTKAKKPTPCINRNLESHSLNKNISQIEEMKTRFSEQLIKTQTLLPSRREEFSIPGVTFKNSDRTISLKNVRKKQNISSTHYETQKMINIESIIQRNCKNFSHLMTQFYKRANISASMIFVFNSEDLWLKNVLIKRGWVQNLNKQSRAYHLSWTYKSPKMLPYPEQLVNHFTESDAITSKYRLKEMLQCYRCSNIQPITFDLSRQRLNFNNQFAKQDFYAKLARLVNLFLFDGQQLSSSYDQMIKQAQQIKILLANEQSSNFNNLLAQMIENCLLSLSGDRLVINSESNMIFKHQLSNLSNLTSLQQKIVILLKGMYNLLKERYYIPQCPQNIWILKSRTGSKGAGILLTNNLNEIYRNESKLVQKYIEDPLLLDGINRHKFDIRLWVLVTGFKYTQIYYYKDFYGRICSQKYNCEPENIRNEYMHLTNYSVNKCKYEQAENMQGSIIFSQDIFELIQSQYGVDYLPQFYGKIQDILGKLRPIFENEVCHKDKESNRFELFGFDLLIDSKLRLHLLEINLSAKCNERHHKLSVMLENMGNGLLNILQNKQELNDWKLLSKDT